MIRKKAKKSKNISSEIALQITPMASIFTVILVFLIKSVSLGVSNVTPSQDLILPEVKEMDQMLDGLRVEVSKDSIVVDGKSIIDLKNFEFDTKELSEDGGFKVLSRSIASATSDDNKAIIMADVSTPYSTLKRVFASVASQGYYDLKLVVIEDK